MQKLHSHKQAWLKRTQQMATKNESLRTLTQPKEGFKPTFRPTF